MPQPKLKVELKRFHPDAIVPEYKSEMAAGFDLHACIPFEKVVQVAPGETLIIPTGLGIFINNPDYCLEIWERSGMGASGVARRAGLVDADYQGSIGVVLTNHRPDNLVVRHKDRIAQAKLAVVQRAQFVVVEDFSELTKRGEGAWGSTGN